MIHKWLKSNIVLLVVLVVLASLCSLRFRYLQEVFQKGMHSVYLIH